MYNELHKDSKPIPETGTGWKLFQVFDGNYAPITTIPECGDPIFQINEVNIWNGYKNHGFCFFLYKSEAINLRKDWIRDGGYYEEDYVVLPIKYAGGMGTHQEDNITDFHSYQIALCKEFKITSEVPVTC